MVAMNLYTKKGPPLQVRGYRVHSRSGVYVGHISNGKVYDPSGRYARTIVGDRVVYRSTHSATKSSLSTAANRSSTGRGNRGGFGVWGDQPNFPD